MDDQKNIVKTDFIVNMGRIMFNEDNGSSDNEAGVSHTIKESGKKYRNIKKRWSSKSENNMYMTAGVRFRGLDDISLSSDVVPEHGGVKFTDSEVFDSDGSLRSEILGKINQHVTRHNEHLAKMKAVRERLKKMAEENKTREMYRTASARNSQQSIRDQPTVSQRCNSHSFNSRASRESIRSRASRGSRGSKTSLRRRRPSLTKVRARSPVASVLIRTDDATEFIVPLRAKQSNSSRLSRSRSRSRSKSPKGSVKRKGSGKYICYR